MEEMIDDTLEDLDEDNEELTEEADLEVEKVLFDLTDGKLGQLGSAGKDLPVRLPPPLALVTLTINHCLFLIMCLTDDRRSRGRSETRGRHRTDAAATRQHVTWVKDSPPFLSLSFAPWFCPSILHAQYVIVHSARYLQ